MIKILFERDYNYIRFKNIILYFYRNNYNFIDYNDVPPPQNCCLELQQLQNTDQEQRPGT